MKIKEYRMFIMLIIVFFSFIRSSALGQQSFLLDVNDDYEGELNGDWLPGNTKSIGVITFSITKNSQHLTIQDCNPVNTITVKITSNETGATVFENVYPQGQTSFIVIPMDGWSAGSYTIELFGRENNGYLWGTFQVLP